MCKSNPSLSCNKGSLWRVHSSRMPLSLPERCVASFALFLQADRICIFTAILSSGNGSRFVLANTEQLYRKLIAMSERIRQLEDALLVATASLTGERHPLLSDELLAVKHGIDVLRAESLARGETPANGPEQHADDETVVLNDMLGALEVGDGGATRFIGGTGGSEVRFASHAFIPPVIKARIDHVNDRSTRRKRPSRLLCGPA